MMKKMPDMKLHNLFDMTEDVAESEKIKFAESKLVQRQFQVNCADACFLLTALLFF